MSTPLTWTGETPTAEGWYWYRPPRERSGYQAPAVLTDVWRNVRGRLRALRDCGDESDDLDALHGEWAGPLTPPP